MASTITRTTWTNDTGTASAPNADGTVINNAALQAIYDAIDQLFAGAGSYATFTFGGQVKADGQPRASAYNNATQSITDSTLTALTLNSEDFDVGSLHSTSVNTSRMTLSATAGGVYIVVGQTTFAGNATGVRDLSLRLDGTTYVGSSRVTNLAAVQMTFGVSAILTLTNSQYVELIAFQTSGGNLNAGDTARNTASALMIARVW